ncbi:uncharacterized protein LOC110454486 [Mizuhopecten yessoensis]|uniref:Uncharacterized protein n=1 Tax=Mizuhopecten yessoensis TaxID=6573 RepID=A0A210QEZ2_MIZYE|nr:uncharacterized protein LOC110454486 [Mizuhopecten yessoensis]OWF47323.1 hypothetical protein KP79_PYT22617 [Mizuhopecten yessoensis]
MMSLERNERGRKKIMVNAPVFRKLWIFMALGMIIAILGLVTIVVHFLVGNITSSSDLTEILPNYITGLVITIDGMLITVLFWRRHIALVFVEVVLCFGVGALCAALAVLTGTHILQPIRSLQDCIHDENRKVCACTSNYRRNALLLESSKDPSLYTFDGTISCTSVEDILPIFLYVQIGLFAIVFILCVTTKILAFLVLKLERTSLATLQEETYEEIFTVSGSSCSDLNSEDEVTIQTGSNISSAANCVNPAVKGLCDPIGQKHNGIYAQPAGILKNFERTATPLSDLTPTNRLIRSKSCDSIDEIYARSAKGPGSEHGPEKGKGKLKEHRRRERRAVTLHNLDSKQLMSVLSLHMRYLEETEILKSRTKIQTLTDTVPVELKRRAITPQPYQLKYDQTSTLPRTVRSHTPQPNQRLTDKQECQYRMMMKQLIDSPQGSGLQHAQQSTAKSIGSPLQKAKNPANQHNPNKNIMGISHSLPNHRRNEIESIGSESVDASEIDEDLNIKQMPKSRPSVKNYFLPPLPIHRSKSLTPPHLPELQHRPGVNKGQLPPQPIKRGEDPKGQLPLDPVHRGSAFRVPGHSINANGLPNNRIYSRPGDIHCDKALRENFQLYESPFLLHNNGQKTFVQPNFTLSNHAARNLPPPPYAPPPSYKHFMSLSQDGSLSDLVDDESIDGFLHNNQSERLNINPNSAKLKGNRTEVTMSSDDDVFLPEDKAVYSQVAKRPMHHHGDKVSPHHHYHTPHTHYHSPRDHTTPPRDVMTIPPRQPCDPRIPPDGVYNVYANYNMYQKTNPQGSVWTRGGNYPHANNYEEIDDLDVNMTYSYEDNSSCGMSSQASLIPQEQKPWSHNDTHPFTGGEPEVLETMI